MNMEEISKRCGVKALERGFITLDQLLMAINIQILENLEKGEHRLIGRILVELGIISPSKIMMPDSVEEVTGESIKKRFGVILLRKALSPQNSSLAPLRSRLEMKYHRTDTGS